MALSENPFPKLADAADAASQIISLQSRLFFLNQELRAVQQIKRMVGFASGLVFLNMLLTLTFFWIQTGLHERGWSAFQLAFLSFLFFGVLIVISGLAAFRMSKAAKPKGSSL